MGNYKNNEAAFDSFEFNGRQYFFKRIHIISSADIYDDICYVVCVYKNGYREIYTDLGDSIKISIHIKIIKEYNPIYDGINLNNVIGVLHKTDGPAEMGPYSGRHYFLNGIYFHNKEEWFAALTKEEKYKAIWNMD